MTCSTRGCGAVAGGWVLNYSYITSLDTKEDALEVVGGKGRSLAKLANAGFPVPAGFQVTTSAYRRFVCTTQPRAGAAKLSR